MLRFQQWNEHEIIRTVNKKADKYLKRFVTNIPSSVVNVTICLQHTYIATFCRIKLNVLKFTTMFRQIILILSFSQNFGLLVIFIVIHCSSKCQKFREGRVLKN